MDILGCFLFFLLKSVSVKSLFKYMYTGVFAVYMLHIYIRVFLVGVEGKEKMKGWRSILAITESRRTMDKEWECSLE